MSTQDRSKREIIAELRVVQSQNGLLATRVEKLERCQWRPIAEMGYDHGLCVVMNLDHPQHMDVIHALDDDRDSFGWTHFMPIKLTHEDAARLRAEMEGR